MAKKTSKKDAPKKAKEPKAKKGLKRIETDKLKEISGGRGEYGPGWVEC